MKHFQEMISLWEERRANRSRWQGYAKDWKILAATSRLPFATWFAAHVPDGLSGKMYPEPCRREEDGTLVPSSGRWQNSGTVSPGECWTLNTSEFHSGASASFLSDVLETQPVPERYFLSPKACAGILRRAEKRGKKLPESLESALRLTLTADHTAD